MSIERLPLTIATLYAELHDLSEDDRPGQSKEGSYSRKRIGGKDYWYFQKWRGEKRVQKSLGPETAELLAQISSQRIKNKAWRISRRRRQELCRLLRHALRMKADQKIGKVIQQLAEGGAFAAGATLVGTHAYTTYAAMLGRRLSVSNIQTTDIDFAAVNLAASDAAVSFSEIVQRTDKAFFEVPARPGETVSTKLKYSGDETRVELLTPKATGDKEWKPKVLSNLRFGALVVPYLDYLIENPIEATYLYGDGVRVIVPHPARYALHKLIVAANRCSGSEAKALKDLAQASELIPVLAEDRAEDYVEAASALVKCGANYVEMAEKGAKRLDAPIRQLLPQPLRGKVSDATY